MQARCGQRQPGVPRWSEKRHFREMAVLELTLREMVQLTQDRVWAGGRHDDPEQTGCCASTWRVIGFPTGVTKPVAENQFLLLWVARISRVLVTLSQLLSLLPKKFPSVFINPLVARKVSELWNFFGLVWKKVSTCHHNRARLCFLAAVESYCFH